MPKRFIGPTPSRYLDYLCKVTCQRAYCIDAKDESDPSPTLGGIIPYLVVHGVLKVIFVKSVRSESISLLNSHQFNIRLIALI